ncbi:GW dipeptide domain-containing protein [Levilactobacillus parabrevis]|uniref:GW dipeptide domain-containing protein n=1 Tax=Levilactobacillus parabrevis TaxID=357278 RepID=UPI00375816F6
MKWMKFALAGSLGLALWGATTTAQAAKKVTLPAYPQHRVFTFKAKGTKVYSYPRAAYAHSKVLGTNLSTKKHWTVDKVVTVNGKRYVRLANVTATKLQHGQVMESNAVAATKITGGYVALSKLKFHQQIVQMKSIKKTAYWTPTTTHDFWNMPAKTLGITAANHFGSSYGYKTIYAVQSLTTTTKKHYLYFETAAGKAIGWLPTSAVVKGTYPDNMKHEMSRDGLTAAATKKVATLDKSGHIKIGIATANNQIQRVVMLKQNSQTMTYEYENGKAVRKITRSATGKLLSSKAITPVATLKFKLVATFDLQGQTYQGTISPQGKIDIPVYLGWIA